MLGKNVNFGENTTMTKRKRTKCPQLRNPQFWADNANRTDVEIGRDLGIAHSTVRAARRRMGITPISVSEASRRTWASLEFRKKRSDHPQLYERTFWEKRQGYTNSEIAKEFGCAPSAVKTAREALGFRSLTPSESQKRRFARDFPQSKPGPRKKRGPMTQEIRLQSLSRANNCCESPTCGSHKNLEVDHIIDVRFFPKPSDADYLKNTLVLCWVHHDWWSSKKKKHMDLLRRSESPRQKALEILRNLLPPD